MTPKKRHKKGHRPADATQAADSAQAAEATQPAEVGETAQAADSPAEDMSGALEAAGEAAAAQDYAPSDEPAAADVEEPVGGAKTEADDARADEALDEPPPDPVMASLEELDARERGSGAPLELVEQLEFVAVPKGKRGAAKNEDRDAPLELASVAEARSIIEAFLFTTNEPLPVARISKLMNNLHPRTVRGLLLELQMDYDRRGGALQIAEVAGGFQMATRPQQSDWLLRLHKHRRRSPLSPATLETLAIISYKQPVTKAEIEVIRGVETTAPLYTLQDIGLIEVSGRREVIGRPQLYVTTEVFLKTFGLRSLSDLPSIAELKHLFAEEQQFKLKAAAPAEPRTEIEADVDGGTADDDDAQSADADARMADLGDDGTGEREDDDVDDIASEDGEGDESAPSDSADSDGADFEEALSDEELEAALSDRVDAEVIEEADPDADAGDSRQE
jgi:segregation and condensation protein B